MGISDPAPEVTQSREKCKHGKMSPFCEIFSLIKEQLKLIVEFYLMIKVCQTGGAFNM